MTALLERARSAALWAWAFTLVGILGPAYLVAARLSPARAHEWARRLSRVGLRAFGVRLAVVDCGGRRAGRPCVYVANHVNLLDPFVFAIAIAEPLRAIEVAPHFSWWGWGALVRQAGLIPIDYTTTGGIAGALLQARRELRAGFSIVFLPEGTRTVDGCMNPFRPGPFLLAQKAGVDLVPMVQVGAFAVNNKLSARIRPGPVTLALLPPERHEAIAGERPDDVGARVRARMEAAIAALGRGERP